MTKLRFFRQRSEGSKHRIEVVRLNPDLLETSVINNNNSGHLVSPDRSSEARIMNPVQARAICANTTVHPLANVTFQRRGQQTTSSSPQKGRPQALKALLP
jgi:hypothetical protein